MEKGKKLLQITGWVLLVWSVLGAMMSLMAAFSAEFLISASNSEIVRFVFGNLSDWPANLIVAAAQMVTGGLMVVHAGKASWSRRLFGANLGCVLLLMMAQFYDVTISQFWSAGRLIIGIVLAACGCYGAWKNSK
jgi:hypothetical protein